MNWKPVYAILMFLSTFVTWLCGILVDNSESNLRRKVFLIISLVINFGILFLYKYYDFLNNSVYEALEFFDIRWPVPNLDLLLPVGISFYTFQAVGYTIDVYRKELKAEKHLGIYALFVSFFPQLVAGPIERASNLLPQFKREHFLESDRLVSGIKQMIWGFFMKVVIADRLALFVNAVYSNVNEHNGSTILIATFLFAFQIYCDFAGYSNIAIGSARIMGFDLMTNFNRPYFSVNISEFWHRWHISLSTWFRDYVYIPLGGNRVSERRGYFNIFLTFVISGIWHGANWTFFIWGSLHGLYNIIQKYFRMDKIQFSGFSGQKALFILVNFTLVLLAWVFFRANTTGDAFMVLSKIFTSHGIPFVGSITTFVYGIFGLIILFFREISEEFFPPKLNIFESENPVVSALLNAALIFLIIAIGVFDGGQFIYFQF